MHDGARKPSTTAKRSACISSRKYCPSNSRMRRLTSRKNASASAQGNSRAASTDLRVEKNTTKVACCAVALADRGLSSELRHLAQDLLPAPTCEITCRGSCPTLMDISTRPSRMK